MGINRVIVKDLFNLMSDIELIQGIFDYELLNCCTNTKILKPKETFFAIGEANNYIEDALEKGATGCVVEKDVPEIVLQKYPKATIIKVKDGLEALQRLATYKRSLYDIPVIAITGSVGKTSTKDIVANVLAKNYKVLKTEGNFNNHIGLPITIMKLKEHTALVVEMGMNHEGEIELLSNIAKPTIAVITNIGTAHIGNLGSKRAILKAKLEILKGLSEDGTLIINYDSDLLRQWDMTKDNDKKIKVISVSLEMPSNIKARRIVYKKESSIFSIKSKRITGRFEICVPGEPFVYNALVAAAVANVLKIHTKTYKKGLTNIILTKNRMEILEINQVIYINDAYNASGESMKYSIEQLSRYTDSRKIAVLGDMFELGNYTKTIHKDIGTYINKKDIDILITVGKESKLINQEVNLDIEKFHFDTREDVIEFLKEFLEPKDVVLIKASNSMKLYEIVEEMKKL